MNVKYIPFQPHCFAFGGFELQMLSALDAVVKEGVNARKMDVWSRDNDFEILHCWGLGFHHYENMRWAKHAKKKVVLTALFSYYEGFNEKMRHFFSTYIKKAQYYIQIANLADAVVVVNELQAEACAQYFKVHHSRIHVVPNIVHSIFFEDISSKSFSETYGVEDYVLAVGSVCARKNQLNLIRACTHEGVKLVIIGKLIEGEESYGLQIESEIRNNPGIVWIKGLPANSVELKSAYKDSRLVALPSFIEQQPITLLEAVAMQKPLLIGNGAYSKQKFYDGAACVRPSSVGAIADGIRQITNNPSRFTPPFHNLDECKEAFVGKKYCSVYESILST